MQELQSFCDAHFPRATASRAVVNNLRTALRHLDSFLERTPLIEDLNSRTIAALLRMLEAAGRRPETVRRVRTSFALIGRAAVAAGLIDPLELPTIDVSARQPFTVAELNQMFGSARTMPGEIAGIPATDWWPAMLLTVLDARVPARIAIDLSATAFNPHAGTLHTGVSVLDLHQLTIDALLRIRHPQSEKLLPFDRQLQILYRRMKLLQYRAGIPHVARNLFERLRYTGKRERSVLDEIDLKARFTPKLGQPKLLRARDRRRAQLKHIPRPPADGVYRLSIDSPRTLRRFFEDKSH